MEVPLVVDGPHDVEEEEHVLDEEGVPAPVAQVGPRDEDEVHEEHAVQRRLRALPPRGEAQQAHGGIL